MQIRDEVDDSLVPLIGMFGHSSQELVNLFLSGQAVTNVFDGNRMMGSSSVILSEPVPVQVPFREQGGGPGGGIGLQLRYAYI